MSGDVDDKSEHCVPFILDYVSKKSSDDAHHSPIFIGVNGAQGSGKSTLVRAIHMHGKHGHCFGSKYPVLSPDSIAYA